MIPFWKTSSDTAYTALSLGPNQRPQPARQQRTIVTLLWLSSLALTNVFTWYYFSSSKTFPDPLAVAAFDYNSPLYDTIDLHLDAVVPNSSFFDDGSIYRKEPSPEVDEAWKALEMHHEAFLIGESDLKRLGFPTKGSVRWLRDDLGEPTYIASLDVFHLVHCVNMLRQALDWNYYQPAEKEKINPLTWEHHRHCADVLRQEIMCAGSLNVYRYVWMEMQDAPFVDFTINRQCRRWDDIVKWHDEHKVDHKEWVEFVERGKPKGQWEFPLTPAGRKSITTQNAWGKKWNLTDENGHEWH